MVPHVVHFSGHADADGLLMENDAGEDGDDVGFTLLARILGATDDPPRLVVLNACESLDGADDLLQTVPVVVGMSDSIDDTSAIVFAAASTRASRPHSRSPRLLSRQRSGWSRPRSTVPTCRSSGPETTSTRRRSF
jgi:hypothetical protein